MSRARGPPTFRLIQTVYTRKLVGPDGAIGSDRADRASLTSISIFQESPRFRAQPRFEICRPNGTSIVSQAKSPPTFRLPPITCIRECWLGRNGRLARDRRNRYLLASISIFQESPRVRAQPRFEIWKVNGAIIVSQARSPTTFRLLPIRHTRRLVGLGWAIGSGPGRLRIGYDNIDLSRKPALSCTVSV